MIMEKDVSKIVSINLCKLRKSRKMTQAELAGKFNFSDKTISKWESGESLPSIDVLAKLSEFYGITLNDLTSETLEVDEEKKLTEMSATSNKVIISLLVVSLVWLIATILYVYVKIITNYNMWRAFIWSVPISIAVIMVFNGIWGNRRNAFFMLSLFLWTLIASFYLQFLSYNLWPIFILGIPSQVAIILWSKIKPKKKNK